MSESWDVYVTDALKLLSEAAEKLDEAYLIAEETNDIIIDMHGVSETELDNAMFSINKVLNDIEDIDRQLKRLKEGIKHDV